MSAPAFAACMGRTRGEPQYPARLAKLPRIRGRDHAPVANDRKVCQLAERILPRELPEISRRNLLEPFAGETP